MEKLRNIKDIKFAGTKDNISLYTKDMRGEPEVHNVLDFSAENLYSLIMSVYELGRKDKTDEIKRILR